MKIKVSELEGARLDYWVAKAKELPIELGQDGKFHGYIYRQDEDGNDDWYIYSPSADWSQGGPIVEREDIAFGYKTNTGYAKAHILHKDQTKSITHFGKTKLIAAMRCYVSSKFGEEVKDD